MDEASLRKFNRAIELWRRQTRSNIATKDAAAALLDQLSEAGFAVSAASADTPIVTDSGALLMRRAAELEADGSVEGQIEGLRLRLQALGG